MMRRQTIAELGEQPSAIAAAADHQLLERPGLAGAQSQSLGVDDRSEALRRARFHAKPPAEARARTEREERRLLTWRRERQKTVERASAFVFGNAVVLCIGVLAE